MRTRSKFLSDQVLSEETLLEQKAHYVPWVLGVSDGKHGPCISQVTSLDNYLIFISCGMRVIWMEGIRCVLSVTMANVPSTVLLSDEVRDSAHRAMTFHPTQNFCVGCLFLSCSIFRCLTFPPNWHSERKLLYFFDMKVWVWG